MDDFQLLVDLHKRAKRQGPGGDVETRKAIDLAMLDPSAPLKVADIGCGTGASTIQLARLLNVKITAIDFLPEFIEVLKGKAENEGLSKKINPLVCSMENLQFDDEEYDVIWSEGAIYNIGFEKGINDWRRFLKPGGLLVVSEITWTTSDRPSEIQKYWEAEYPEIDTLPRKSIYWRRMVILRSRTLFYQSVAGWKIIIGHCKTVLPNSYFGMRTTKMLKQ